MKSKKLLTASMIAGIAALFAIPTGIAFSSGCSIVGTPNNDRITGTSGVDGICGLAGDDRIQTGDSNDYVDPGTGADRVATGNGDDFIFLNPGDDNAKDMLLCGEGYDTVYYIGDVDPDDVLKGCENIIDA